MSLLLVFVSFLSLQTVYAKSTDTCPQILQKDSICKIGKGDFACSNQLDFDCAEVGDSVRLLGKGVANAEKNASISLACSDEACLSLRYIYMAEGKNYFFGPTYRVPYGKNSTEADLEVTRNEMLEIFKTLRIYNWRSLGTGEKMRGAFSDRDGWNWSAHPLDRDEERFNRILFTLDGYHETSLVDRIAQRSVKKICAMKDQVGGFDSASASWLNLVLSNRGNAQVYFPALVLVPGQFMSSLKGTGYEPFFRKDIYAPCEWKFGF